jgi:hypothetical protein
MTVYKYLAVGTNNIPTETTPNTTSAGSADANKLVALNSSGLIDTSMLPTSSAVTRTASEAISAGALISEWNNSGTINVRNADNSTYKPAHGYAPSAISSSGSGSVYLFNGPAITGLTGLTVGGECFLGTAGAITQTAPAQGSGSLLQKVGVAATATSMDFLLQIVPIQR